MTRFSPRAKDAQLDLNGVAHTPKTRIPAWVLRDETSGLAVTQCAPKREALDVRGWWAVTHSRSGQAIVGRLSFGKAVQMLNRLAAITDWKLEPDEYRKQKGLHEQVRTIYREVAL